MHNRFLKRFTIFSLVMTVALSSTFATEAMKAGDYTISLSFITNAVNLIVGIFAGGYVLLKAALDIFHAVRNSSEDQNALKKAIGSLVLNVAILGGFMFVVNYVFAGMSDLGDAPDIAEQEASSVFFAALSGTLAEIPVL